MKIVCFSEIQWHYLRTRKQQILTRFPRDWEILFLSTVVQGKRNNFLPKRDGRVVHVCIPIFKNFPQAAIRAMFSIPLFRFLWNVVMYLWLNVVFIVTGFAGHRRIFYVSNIYYAAVLGHLSRSVMLYDCNDDPLGFENTPAWASGYFERLVREADITVAVSGGLVDLLKKTGAGAVQRVANGVDYDLFSEAAAAGVPDELRNLAKPVIGYVGAIAHWFDFGLIGRLACDFPEASLVLVGPVYRNLEGELGNLLERHRNIHHLGSRPYGQLGGYIAAMDVCLIPLKVTELRRMADPNKLYEYAAAGKPIVTMKYSEDMEAMADIIYLAESADGFVEKVRIALERGVDRQKLVAFARESSWQVRADAMADLILNGLGKERERS
ncbi:MAG: glycosyltransferase [bacterium]|nr:MAG: glycosyltransferase [bacterium]